MGGIRRNGWLSLELVRLIAGAMLLLVLSLVWPRQSLCSSLASEKREAPNLATKTPTETAPQPEGLRSLGGERKAIEDRPELGAQRARPRTIEEPKQAANVRHGQPAKVKTGQKSEAPDEPRIIKGWGGGLGGWKLG